MNLNRLDKSWYSNDRRTKRYKDGVKAFLNYVKKNLGDLSFIQYPCIKCGNMKVRYITVVKDHLFVMVSTQVMTYGHGMTKTYVMLRKISVP